MQFNAPDEGNESNYWSTHSLIWHEITTRENDTFCRMGHCRKHVFLFCRTFLNHIYASERYDVCRYQANSLSAQEILTERIYDLPECTPA